MPARRKNPVRKKLKVLRGIAFAAVWGVTSIAPLFLFAADKDETAGIGSAKKFAESFIKDKSEKTTPRVIKPSDSTWDSIRQKKINTSGPLSLTDLIDIALRNNPSTRRAWNIASAAVAVHRQSRSTLYPKLNYSSDATYEREFSNSPAQKINDTHYGQDLQLTYLLLDFGGRSANIEETAQKLATANALYNQAIQDLLLQVERSYYGFYSAKAALEAAELNVETAKKDLDAAQEKLSAGMTVRLDVLQSQSDYDDALYSLEVAKNDVKNTRATLAQALGIAPDMEFDVVTPKQEFFGKFDARNVNELIDEAIAERPDVASSRATLLASKAAIKAAESGLWPTFNLGGTSGKDWYTDRGNSVAAKDDYNYSGFLKVDWDIFDGFLQRNKKRQAQSEFDAQLENLIQVELEASTDVLIKYNNLRAAESKLKLSQSLFDSSSLSYDLALESYKTGLKTIIDLIQAQNQLTDARSKVIQSQQEIFVSFAELVHAVGLLTVSSSTEAAKKQ